MFPVKQRIEFKEPVVEDTRRPTDTSHMKVMLFPQVCHNCSSNIGVLQSFLEGKPNIPGLLKEMGITRVCCIKAITSPTMRSVISSMGDDVKHDTSFSVSRPGHVV